MSPNDERIQEATLLFVSQFIQRPEQLTANLNCLLSEQGIIIGFTRIGVREQEPKETLFDIIPPHRWEPPIEMEEA